MRLVPLVGPTAPDKPKRGSTKEAARLPSAAAEAAAALLEAGLPAACTPCAAAAALTLRCSRPAAGPGRCPTCCQSPAVCRRHQRLMSLHAKRRRALQRVPGLRDADAPHTATPEAAVGSGRDAHSPSACKGSGWRGDRGAAAAPSAHPVCTTAAAPPLAARPSRSMSAAARALAGLEPDA